MLSDQEREALYKQISEMNDWLRFVWTEFLKWFAFFCTLNVAAIGSLHFVDVPSRVYVEAVFLLLNIGACISSIFVLFYSRSSAIRLQGLHNKLKTTYPDEWRIFIQSIAPASLALWTAFAIILAFILFILIWGVFLWIRT